MLDYTQILTNAQKSSYVPPMSTRQLGIALFEAGEPVDACTTAEMRKGWLWAFRASAWADGAAYLVSQGQEVSL